MIDEQSSSKEHSTCRLLRQLGGGSLYSRENSLSDIPSEVLQDDFIHVIDDIEPTDPPFGSKTATNTP